MTESRCQLLCVSRRSEPWLVRVYDPRPHAEHERRIDYLCPVFKNEVERRDGRFHNHVEGWLEHCVAVDFSEFEEHGEQVLQLELMLEWIAREGVAWNLVAPARDDLVLEFWFAETYAANVFGLMYGGCPAKIERV